MESFDYTVYSILFWQFQRFKLPSLCLRKKRFPRIRLGTLKYYNISVRFYGDTTVLNSQSSSVMSVNAITMQRMESTTTASSEYCLETEWRVDFHDLFSYARKCILDKVYRHHKDNVHLSFEHIVSTWPFWNVNRYCSRTANEDLYNEHVRRHQVEQNLDGRKSVHVCCHAPCFFHIWIWYNMWIWSTKDTYLCLLRYVWPVTTQ